MIKVLVVDDEELFLEMICEFLKSLDGIQVFGALNSKVALEILEKERPAILLLDINLRESLSGFDIHKKALEILGKAYSIVISGDTSQDIADRCLKQGIERFLPKPVSLKELHAVLKEFIQKINP